MAHVVIIGNGIAGITCARHLRKRCDDRITVISGESKHFFSRTALMYIYMGHMKYEHTKPYEDWFWEKNRIGLKHAWVTDVNTTQKSLTFSDEQKMTYDKLVIASGSVPNKIGWPGEDLSGVQGLYSLQDLELLEKNTHAPLAKEKKVHHAVIVGGGLIGIELAEMLRTRGMDVTMLVRESHFWGNNLPKEEAEMVERHIRSHGVKLKVSTELQSIHSGPDGRVAHVETSMGERIGCQFVGLTIGVRPNVSFLNSSSIELDHGVVINEYFETNEPDVFAIGDCAQFSDPPEGVSALNQVWYTGRMMGETLALNLTGKRQAYRPGPWFNSAKFFDLEFQTYGRISPTPKNYVVQFYWSDQSHGRLFKVEFDIESFKILGINALGIRLRHEVCACWIDESRPVDDCLGRLKEVLFDAEFETDVLHPILEKWNVEFPERVVRTPRKFSLF